MCVCVFACVGGNVCVVLCGVCETEIEGGGLGVYLSVSVCVGKASSELCKWCVCVCYSSTICAWAE